MALEDAPGGSSAPAAKIPGGKIRGEPVAYDDHGRPVILRQVDTESGEEKTVVLMEDGSVQTFDEEAVSQVADKSKTEQMQWIGDLTNLELRGFTHEVGQRLLKGSRLYHSRHAELEKYRDAANYQFFGVGPNVSEKELDNAYRKLARKMHPDKNGGTEEAKRRFQHMKERYEELKKRRENPQEGPAKGQDEDEEDRKEREEKEREEKEREKKERKEKKEKEKQEKKEKGEEDEEDEEDEGRDDDDEEDDPKEKSTSISYDPADRKSMEKTVTKMLGQLQNINIQMKVLVKELARVRAQYPGMT